MKIKIQEGSVLYCLLDQETNAKFYIFSREYPQKPKQILIQSKKNSMKGYAILISKFKNLEPRVFDEYGLEYYDWKWKWS